MRNLRHRRLGIDSIIIQQRPHYHPNILPHLPTQPSLIVDTTSPGCRHLGHDFVSHAPRLKRTGRDRLTHGLTWLFPATRLAEGEVPESLGPDPLLGVWGRLGLDCGLAVVEEGGPLVAPEEVEEVDAADGTCGFFVG